MQPLIEFIIGLVALIAATALAQFDVDLTASTRPDPEVRRIVCEDPVAPASSRTAAAQDC